MPTTTTPLRGYPAASEIRKVAAFAYAGFERSGSTACGHTFEDMQQEIHLKICEVFADYEVPDIKLLYASMWNKARNLRARDRTAARFTASKELVVDYLLDPSDTLGRLDGRSCLRCLDARLSPTHKDTLTRAAVQLPRESQHELGISGETWRKRRHKAREAARAALS